MARLLLIEDEGIWLDLIQRALPEHIIDPAKTYDEALALLGSDHDYPVAIVDLNLLPEGSDGLGGELLTILKDQFPLIRRIVLTGVPPTAVRPVFEKYDPDDLLLKQEMDLAVLRDVVNAAVRRAGASGPEGFLAWKGELKARLRSWEERAILRLEQLAQTLRNDVDEANRVGKRTESSVRALADLQIQMQKLRTECADFAEMVGNVDSEDDKERASEVFDSLQATYGT